jgi:SAM-dependent methyltransferase
MTQPLTDLQQQINHFWNWRGTSRQPGGLAIRNEQELQVWMEVMGGWLPPAPADVVDLGTGQGFLALVLAAFGHRVRGFDVAEAQLERAREFAASVPNPPSFALGDAIEPPLDPASVDVLANRNIMWTLLEPARAFRNWFTALRPGGRLIALHGITNTDSTAITEEAQTRDQAAYSAAIKEHLLPIRRLPTVEPALPLVRAAGFVDVQVTRLEAIEQFEKVLENRNKTWLAITAVRPLE